MRERLLRALNASDLSIEEYETACHLVASLGAAQIGNRKHLSIGALLLHIKAGHTNFVTKALGLIALTIASRARRQAWAGVGRHNAFLIAELALTRFLDSLCKSCNGVGKIGDFGQVIVICQSCKGSGKRRDDDRADAEHLGMSLQAFRANELAERIKDVIALMDRMEGLAAGATKRQARG